MNNLECSFCLDLIINRDYIILNPCLHKFHSDCFKIWTKNICPFCNYDIKNKILIKKDKNIIVRKGNKIIIRNNNSKIDKSHICKCCIQ